MLPSVRALLAGIIDYAGLFPPARLPMDQAVRNFARYRQEPESWMLGRFICPATRLEEVIPLENELFQGETPIRFSILGRGGVDLNTFTAGVTADMNLIRSFQQRWEGRAVLDGYETFLAKEADPLEQLPYWFLAHSTTIKAPNSPIRVAFWELRAVWELRGLLVPVLKNIPPPAKLPLALKLRCGGLDASAFPTPEHVAATITMSRDAKVPLKFTAGLHHPFRYFDPTVIAMAHGFLNVFGAGVLAHSRGLSTDQVQDIIADEDSSDFVFGADGFRWKDLHATTNEIIAARNKAVISFGSCSFEEPRADLRACGLLD